MSPAEHRGRVRAKFDHIEDALREHMHALSDDDLIGFAARANGLKELFYAEARRRMQLDEVKP